jgi:hypothetical protein
MQFPIRLYKNWEITKSNCKSLFKIWQQIFHKKNFVIQIFFLTWCLPNYLLAFIVFILIAGRCQVSRYQSSVCLIYPPNLFSSRAGAVCLGNLLLVPQNASKELIAHEYGHSLQNLYLGPLYFLLIGLPSFIRACSFSFGLRKSNSPYEYYHCFVEAWADHLGGVYSLHEHPKPRYLNYLPWQIF